MPGKQRAKTKGGGKKGPDLAFKKKLQLNVGAVDINDEVSPSQQENKA